MAEDNLKFLAGILDNVLLIKIKIRSFFRMYSAQSALVIVKS